MRHAGYTWIEAEGEGSKTPAEIEITPDSVVLRVGSSVVDQWPSRDVRLRPAGPDRLRLEVHSDNLIFQPDDQAAFLADSQALIFRSRMAVNRPASAPVPDNPQLALISSPVKNPGISAVLSFFFPGLGQIYSGEIGKGIAFIVAQVVSLILIFVVIGIFTSIGIWIWGMVDGYQGAERYSAALRGGGSLPG